MQHQGRASSLLPTPCLYLVVEKREANTFLKFLSFITHLEVGLCFYTPLKLVPCLENSMDGGAWRATVHGVTKNQTQLSDF